MAFDETRRDAFAERIMGTLLSTMDLFTIYLGERLGLYQALAEGGPATPEELAERAGVHARYAREWLEQQAVTGMIEVNDPGETPEARRFRLPEEHAEVLLDEQSLSYLAPFARMGSALRPTAELLAAYRSGGGVSWEAYGEDMREGQAAINRPAFTKLLGNEWLPAIADLDARLRAEPPARVADVACGAGWSSIGIATAYPKVLVHGLDLDAAAIERAKANAESAGVADRVTFEARDAADPRLAGTFDLVTIFEALHDMSRPIDILRAIRGLLVEGGSVLVVDERVADGFTAPGDDIERMMYGWSTLSCLPNGMAEQPSAGTGTVMRADTLRRYATDAGFTGVEVLPIENDFFRFYRLTP